VGQDDTDTVEARRIVGPNAIVGLSTYSVEQIEAPGQKRFLGAQMPILIVEDDLDLLDILCFTLRRDGHDVIAAHDFQL